MIIAIFGSGHIVGILISFIPINVFGFSSVQLCLALYVLVPIVYILPGRIDHYWAGKRH